MEKDNLFYKRQSISFIVHLPERIRLIPLVFLFFLISTGCKDKHQQTLFTRLDPATSGIDFINEIRDNDSSFSFINEFGYMGGGVGIGDFNNDGQKDIFFTGNQVSSRLYINQGNSQFEDLTEKAGVVTHDWATGVSIADVNADGFDDIYVCVIGKDLTHRAKNLLFINQHDLSFKEQGVAYGLADTGYSSQAAFFDYDKDGDLDMYLVNYLLTDRNTNTIYPRDWSGRSPANDRLYRNDGDSAGRGHPVFTDVSMEANIREDGYGLSVAVSDYNLDGWPDLYVGNDFLSNDLLWLNDQHGGFTNVISRSMMHQSYSSMGADAADLNNDLKPDLVVLDMLPEDNLRRKTSFSFMNYQRYQAERQMGYDPEFMRNVLQLNQGSIANRDTLIPFFSEIGQLAGIQATDWSWSALLADFNNDGWKDLHVTNGTGRDFINTDFLEFSSSILTSAMSQEEIQKAVRKKLASLDHVELPNYLFLNNKDFSFSNYSAEAGVDIPSMSNGAAYADLDNDGDLDLVVNNINQKAFLYLNNVIQKDSTGDHHYLTLRLSGDSLNTKAIGSKAFVHHKGRVQMQELYPVRGYFSTVDHDLLFGLGKNEQVDSVVIIWPDNRVRVLHDVKADTLLKIDWSGERGLPARPANTTPTLFTDITTSAGIGYRHVESVFDDYSLQRLLPQKFSQLGPYLSVADVNLDGEPDFYIGGAISFSGKVFTKQAGAAFRATDISTGVKLEEDLDCVFLDADKDGDPDLLVTGGDVQFEEGSPYYRPRLYMNDGKGNFSLNPNAIPAGVETIAGCVATSDFDEDGDLDVFIGGRVSRQYPLSPRSFLLRNNNGQFTDVTESLCPGLTNPGMVTSAAWVDIDNDRSKELVITGEWMPVRVFKNVAGKFIEVTEKSGLSATNGMWRSLAAADIDMDGDMDLVAGNQGLNTEYKASDKEPMELWAADMDNNGTIDPVMFYHITDQSDRKQLYPSISRGTLSTQVPAVKKRFLLNSDYGKATARDIFKGVSKEKIIRSVCYETRTCIFENTGNGVFVKRVLPMEAQFAPVNAIICEDLDADGFVDLLLAGNEYQTEVMAGRQDASYGLFLKGNGQKSFLPQSPLVSGFLVRGDVKDMALITSSGAAKYVLVAVNDDYLRVFQINR